MIIAIAVGRKMGSRFERGGHFDARFFHAVSSAIQRLDGRPEPGYSDVVPSRHFGRHDRQWVDETALQQSGSQCTSNNGYIEQWFAMVQEAKI